MSAPPRTTKATHPDLPPGLVLGPDGKPCKVCNSWQDWAKLKVKKKAEGAGTASGSSSSSAASSSGSSASSSSLAGMMAAMSSASARPATPAAPAVLSDRSSCPPDTAALGRSTWTFLHTTAAYYPVAAPASTQAQMLGLLNSLSLLYPCVPCADDFQYDMARHPPDVSGRAALSRWLCERHNEVNEKLGKEAFECSESKLGERWKDGPADGRCD